MSIQVKRQGNLNATSCSDEPLKPNSLAYGELALDSQGYVYAGNGHGQVVSLIRASDRAAYASTSQYSLASVNSEQLQGRVLTTSSFGTSATFSNKIPYIQGNSLEISKYIDFHGDSSSRDYSLRLNSETAGNLIITGPSASTVTANYFNGDSKNSNALGGQSINYFAKATDLFDIPYRYSAIFTMTNWSGEGPYTQTVSLMAEDGGPSITSSSQFSSSVMCEQTSNQSTNEILQEVLQILNSGYLTLGDNSISASVFEKPTADIKVYFLIKK